ncbi:MAG: hypothetical protein ACOYZ7_01895 [Chloroflexota bacterium]
MTEKGKQRTPPDLMSELLGSLEKDVVLPGLKPKVEATGQQENITTEQHVDIPTNRLIDLTSRPQSVKAQTRKRDGLKLTRKTYYLTPHHVRLLKEYAFLTDQGESEIVRQALDDFFAQHGHKAWSTA